MRHSWQMFSRKTELFKLIYASTILNALNFQVPFKHKKRTVLNRISFKRLSLNEIVPILNVKNV